MYTYEKLWIMGPDLITKALSDEYRNVREIAHFNTAKMRQYSHTSWTVVHDSCRQLTLCQLLSIFTPQRSYHVVNPLISLMTAEF